VRHRVEYLDAYNASLSRLDDSPETRAAVQELLAQVTYFPERTPPVTGQFMRVVKTSSAGGYRPLRLFYWLDEGDVMVVHIEAYDELAL
jgi:hypothetical protein